MLKKAQQFWSKWQKNKEHKDILIYHYAEEFHREQLELILEEIKSDEPPVNAIRVIEEHLNS